MSEILYGRNAVRECLRARRRHSHQLVMIENIEKSPIIDEIVRLAKGLKVPIQAVPRRKLDELAGEHQGVALQVGNYPLVDVTDILNRAKKLAEPPFLLALDHLTDPHNLGAILRTAEAVGVHGVIIPKKRAVAVTPAVVKASAGATEHMRVAQVANLVQTLNPLKQENIWVIGVEGMPQATPYQQANLSGATALVIGSEGTGLSRLVKETCDLIIRLPMRGQIGSLNASVAAGLALYEVWRARSFE